MSGTLWVVASLLLLALELLGPSYVFCWLAAGALFAGIASWLGLASIELQLLVFAVSSTVLVVSSRTLLRPWLLPASRGARTLTNAAALPGQIATAISPVDGHAGQVMLHGMEWSARSLDERPIPEGARVRVIQVDGVKLIVDPENGENP